MGAWTWASPRWRRSCRPRPTRSWTTSRRSSDACSSRARAWSGRWGPSRAARRPASPWPSSCSPPPPCWCWTSRPTTWTFEGAVVLASHDRYFLRQVANRIVEVRDQRLVDYKGDYDVFLQENDEEAEAEEVRVGEKKRKDQKKIKAKSKMSKAEKTRLKKEKAKAFQAKKKGGKTKNAGRWS